MNLKRLGILLTPSLLSGCVVVILSVLILLGATWSYSVGSGTLYDILFGKNSSVELISNSRSAMSAFANTVFGNTTLNKILYFAFWMLVGLFVYVVLFALIRGGETAVRDAQEATYTNVKKLDLFKSILVKAGLHLAVIAALVIYWIFFVEILFPFSILAARIGLSELPYIMGLVYSPLSLFIMVLSIHINIVFMRLLLLRVRIYDSV